MDAKRKQDSSSNLSVKSDSSKGEPPSFSNEERNSPCSETDRVYTNYENRPASASYMSMTSEQSMDRPKVFHSGDKETRNVIQVATRPSAGGPQAKTEEYDLKLPPQIEDWTKEQVKDWLVIILRVPQQIAEKLYDQELTGICLGCFEKDDLIELGVPPAPAIQIIRQIEKFRRCSGAHLSRSHYEVSKGELWETTETQVVLGYPDEYVESETVQSDSSLTEHMLQIPKNRIESVIGQQTTNDMQLQNKTADTATVVQLQRPICYIRPFDKSDNSIFYRQNDILPPVAGPSNLLDPVHEYQLLPIANESSEKEILYEFTKALFSFAASCMNSRTNGTIHFGVHDLPGQGHGEVVGHEITSFSLYNEEFELCLDKYFEEQHVNAARMCIRPPNFIKVQSQDGTPSKKWVIEVDVVPTFSETQQNIFFTLLSITSAEKKQQCRTKCLFVRDGPRSINILADANPPVQETIKSLVDKVHSWASERKRAEEKHEKQLSQGHQGQRLKQLITRGRDVLDNSMQVIVVMDKCHSSQLEHLDFLTEIKPFAVLDFDPESDVNGTCSFYRRDHTANLHYPHMYNTKDSLSAIMKKLNLFKQTSWIFCNGQVNESSEMDKPLTQSEWLRKRSGDIHNMVSLLCNPDLLSKDRLLLFILHSKVTDISSPILETFCAIYRALEGADNMLCICKNSTVFSCWQQLIESRCKEDITTKCIYELSLNEISSTIKKLKEPQTQPSRRFLPSTGSSSVLLTKKDEELMTVLDIVCENECQKTEIETMASFPAFKKKTEEDFYKGGKVSWWNFYLSEKEGSLPFIKRDKFNELHDLITPVEDHSSPFVIINLFHHPGCGGTTLAMHVLWNLRHKFRCAVVKNNMATNEEIAAQVMKLLTYGKQDQSRYTPVLLLVDNWNDIQDLKRCILTSDRRRHSGLMAIILNCERTQFPRESSRDSSIANVFIINKLSATEQRLFSEKLQQLKSCHEKPETFYAFMIMTNNFSETYITNVVSNIIEKLDTATPQGRLFSFLALLNSYIDGSYMSLCLCEELVGIRNALWGQETLDDKMNPYSTLMMTFAVEEHGTYQAVRFLHQMIAKKCCELLAQKYKLSLAEITINVLYCDRLYKSCMGKDFLVQNIQSMLVTRHRKDQGGDKDTLFSPLIEDIHNAEGPDKIKEVLERAIERFERSATLPQALARYLCLKQKDFKLALKWALDAQGKNSNSYIADTVGQVYKSHLKKEVEDSKELTPEALDKCLTLGFKAVKAFKESQELAKKDEQTDPFDQHTKKKPKSYNTSGYIGETEVMMILLGMIKDVPLFDVNDRYKRDKMLQSLGDLHTLSSSYDRSNTTINQFVAVLTDHQSFLVSLKPRLKDIFQFFETYFQYLKPRSREREIADERNKRKVSEYFEKYIKIFNISEEEKASETACKPKLSLHQTILDQRHYLEKNQADSFAGLLQCLNDKKGFEMEHIVEKWQFILDNSPSGCVTDTVNFILANIVLHNIQSSSKLLKRYEDLVDLLKKELQKEGTHSKETELYYLSMLLLWPTQDRIPENSETYKNISMYVTSAKRSFHQRFSYMFPARSAIAHFYLGKSTGFKRMVSRVKLDKLLRGLFRGSKTADSDSGQSNQSRNLHHIWQSGAAWNHPEVQRKLLRIKGKSENGDIYINYGDNLKMPVRPVYLGDIRSGYSRENVSFYLGFTMEGPVAYDIKYESDQRAK